MVLFRTARWSGRSVRLLTQVFAIITLLGCVAVGAMLFVIHQSVRAHCRVAQQAHPHVGDDVAALIDFLDSPAHSLRERNEIGVWTLGRLGDARAMPVLQAYYTGESCDHERNLCQYELLKAIRRCRGTVDSPPRASETE